MRTYFKNAIAWITPAFAHVGEEVEEHSEEIETAVQTVQDTQAGINIGPLVFAGVAAVGIVAFILWFALKK